MTITELSVVSGSTPDVPAPAGFTRIDADLNRGAGGKYIYLCVKRAKNEAPLRGLTVVSGLSPFEPAPQDFVRIDHNLNEGIAGRFVFLCASTGYVTPGPIDQIIIQSSRHRDIAPPDGACRVEGDLNEGVGGDYIYVNWRYPDDDPIYQIFAIAGDRPATSTGSGYCLVQGDLNEGAGGKFINLEFVKNGAPINRDTFPVDGSGPITDLRVVVSPFAAVPVNGRLTVPGMPSGFELLPQDLNAGAGGSYVYLIGTRDPKHGKPIKGVKVVSSLTPNPAPPPGFVRLDPEVNVGAGGKFVHVCIRR
jgi:hypothetical protein